MKSVDGATKVYFGGALFKFGDLAGNLSLAEAVSDVSGGDFVCVLPQDFECREPGPKAVRDADFLALLDCDCAIFNFDGLELDSGTVAEFMFAKAIDMPCVLLRTDFRGGGDQGPSGEPWNLMCSFHPRTETVVFDTLKHYKRLRTGISREISQTVVEALRKALAQPPLEKGGAEGAGRLLLWALTAHGLPSLPDFPGKLLERKLSRRLI